MEYWSGDDLSTPPASATTLESQFEDQAIAEDPLDRTEKLVDSLLAQPSLMDDPVRYPRVIRKKQFVYTQFIKEGYHAFPEAGTDEKFATGDKFDVSHLATRHMHYFYFKVWVEVTHSNRDIEFIQLRRWLEGLYDTRALEMNNKSCEMLSDDLYEIVSAKYPDVEIRIDVSEDNINGSFSIYPTE